MLSFSGSETRRLVGILDWTDVILGDPARDFVGLVAWGALDGGFRDRLSFMARLLSVMWLAFAHERDSDFAKHVGWVQNAFE